MKLFKEITFASALTLLALAQPPLALAGDTKIGDLVVQKTWARPSPMMAEVAAGFMVITNTGLQNDRLIKATADITTNVQLHDMKIENDVMKMIELKEGIVIPAGQTVELKPKSLHVMFVDLKASPVEGQIITGTLTFERAGEVAISYTVTNAPAAMN